MGEECSTHLRNENWAQGTRRVHFWGLDLDGRGDNIEMYLKASEMESFCSAEGPGASFSDHSNELLVPQWKYKNIK